MPAAQGTHQACGQRRPAQHSPRRCGPQAPCASPLPLPHPASGDDTDPSRSGGSCGSAAYDGSHPLDAAASLEAALAAPGGAALAWTVPWVLRYLWFLKWDADASQSPYFRREARGTARSVLWQDEWLHEPLTAWPTSARSPIPSLKRQAASTPGRRGACHTWQRSPRCLLWTVVSAYRPSLPTGACCAAWLLCVEPLSCGQPSPNSPSQPSACGQRSMTSLSGWAQSSCPLAYWVAPGRRQPPLVQGPEAAA